MGILGSLLWIAWIAALLVALVRAARRTAWWAPAGVASAAVAAAVLAVQTDVIGDPWVGYVLWSLAGLTLSRPNDEPAVEVAAGRPVRRVGAVVEG